MWSKGQMQVLDRAIAEVKQNLTELVGEQADLLLQKFGYTAKDHDIGLAQQEGPQVTLSIVFVNATGLSEQLASMANEAMELPKTQEHLAIGGDEEDVILIQSTARTFNLSAKGVVGSNFADGLNSALGRIATIMLAANSLPHRQG